MTESLWTRQELGIKHSVEKYGLAINYIGGKRKISHTLLETMLNDSGLERPAFYDLFGGGGSMSFQSAYYGLETIYNDIDKDLYILFKDLHTMQSQECIDFFRNNFITKDLFKIWQGNNDNFALKTALLNAYSYGGAMKFYLFNKMNSLIKRYNHYAITKNSYEAYEAILAYYLGKTKHSEACELIMNLFEYLKGFDWIERVKIFLDFFIKFECLSKVDYAFLKKKFGGDNLFDNVLNMKQSESLALYNEFNQSDYKRILDIKDYDSTVAQVKHIINFFKVLKLCEFENYHLIDFQNKSYDKVEIKHSPSECIIYCDIPYKNIGDKIYKSNISGFDFDKFYEYARKLAKKGYNVYVSEYEMPSEFKCLLEIDYRTGTCRQKDFLRKQVVERLFKA